MSNQYGISEASQCLATYVRETTNFRTDVIDIPPPQLHYPHRATLNPEIYIYAKENLVLGPEALKANPPSKCFEVDPTN